MPFTIIGDPHAKPSNLDKINQIFDQIEDLGHDCIILGDLLDTKEVVRGSCLNTYLKRIKKAKNLKFLILVGNHDYFNLQCQEHSLEPLKELKNAIIIDEPVLHQGMLFLPYINDSETFRAILQVPEKIDYLFCHADIKTFDYGNGILSKEGLEIKDFSRFKKVISGHYHKTQNINNITYLGTPFSESFGEANQQKVIGLFYSENGELTLIPTKFPRHLSFEEDCSQSSKFELNLYPNDIIRIILKGTQEEIDKYPKLEGIRYIEQPRDENSQILVNETHSPELQFLTWSKDIKGYSDEITGLGLEILRDV